MAGQYRKNKYGNKKTVYNGIKYDSKKEAEYAFRLDVLKKSGEVNRWERQINYKLEVQGIKICSYRLDFKVYYSDGRIEYVDVKGYRTTEYKIKAKLMRACHGIQIKEV